MNFESGFHKNRHLLWARIHEYLETHITKGKTYTALIKQIV